jgi:membrane-bound inhibitor of C-type lysozyme
VLALAACSRPPPAESPKPDAETVARITYACDDGRTVRAQYPDAKTAQVKLDGEMHQMTLAVSGSGARYVGDGLQWWTKGEEGMLATLRDGEEIAASPGVRCAPPSHARASPPDPGTPDGLPDERRPLDERPAKPGSPQAAYTVAETYYALLESGRTGDAAKLRVDGVAEDLTRFDTLHANIGRPVRAGGGEISAPVVLYGRLATGPEFLQSGKVLLRREGATWRIARIDVRP